jgi:hypothetical protein
MELSQQLTCPCNNKVYRSVVSLKAHQKTQGHLFWEQNKEQKDNLIKINRLENENSHLRRLNILLMERISELKNESDLKI